MIYINKSLLCFIFLFYSGGMCETVTFTHANGAIATDYYTSQGITNITNGYFYNNQLEHNTGSNPIIITFYGNQTTVIISLTKYQSATTATAWTGENGTGSQVVSQTISNGSTGQLTLTNGTNTIKSLTITQTNGAFFNDYDNLIYDTALPVELVSFKVSQHEKAVNLNWFTATEVNNYGFEVERLQDCKITKLQDYKITRLEDWSKIGFVQGNGNSSSTKQYSFVDNTITKNGIYKYRLKQIDNDGTFKYSDAVEVNVNCFTTGFELAQNYPNPFNPSTTISFTLPETDNVSVKIYDIMGREVATILDELKESGEHKIVWNGRDNTGNDAASGMYFYKLQCTKGSISRQMILIR